MSLLLRALIALVVLLSGPALYAQPEIVSLASLIPRAPYDPARHVSLDTWWQAQEHLNLARTYAQAGDAHRTLAEMSAAASAVPNDPDIAASLAAVLAVRERQIAETATAAQLARVSLTELGQIARFPSTSALAFMDPQTETVSAWWLLAGIVALYAGVLTWDRWRA